MEKIEAYFSFVSWIGNLGVVPLFLSCAFLFWPCLVLLAFLLFSVTAVLETISTLLWSLIQRGFLPRVKLYVKTILLVLCNIFGCLEASDSNLLISIGEHKEIKVKNLKSFTLGNKEVLSAKYLKTKGEILIKGKKLGFSELRYWPQKGAPGVFRIYVLSKRQHLKLAHIMESLKSLDLEVEFRGSLIYAKGVIKTRSDYQILSLLYRKYSIDIILDVLLSADLKGEVLSSVYKGFWDEYIDEVQCEFLGAILECQYPESTIPTTELVDSLKNKFLLHLISTKNYKEGQNLVIFLKLFQIEKLNGENIDLGLSQLESDLNSFFTHDFNSILGRNQIILKKHNLHLSVLVDHRIITQYGKKAILSFGRETLYQEGNTDNLVSKWQFSGLKIETLLTQKGKGLRANYSTELTTPMDSGQGKGGSKTSSAVFLIPEKTQELFEVSMKTFNKESHFFPYLNKIPLLGNLFISKSVSNNYKKIVALIKVVKDPL